MPKSCAIVLIKVETQIKDLCFLNLELSTAVS